jgi:ribulose-phosphate 3-epimerase
MVKISTSVLSKSDKKTILKLNQTNTDYLHIDVMDGLFVTNKAFSIDEIKKVSTITNKPLDIHLMVNDIESYINALQFNNIEFITFHYETITNIKIINCVKNRGIKCGISVKPNTDIKKIFNLLSEIDLVLVMSVEPGYSGQNFINSALDRIEILKNEIIRNDYQTLVAVDGGINNHNAGLCIEKGADILVSSTYITDSEDYQSRIDTLRGNY